MLRKVETYILPFELKECRMSLNLAELSSCSNTAILSYRGLEFTGNYETVPPPPSQEDRDVLATTRLIRLVIPASLNFVIVSQVVTLVQHVLSRIRSGMAVVT
ncbi:hypothetical protein J6590_059316 [Homalodisca vitripennis]|nr:hypothetical protein J6590_059316 [Homalodisca vitripennis]